MNSPWLFRVAGVGLSVLCLTNTNLMRVAAASPGPGDDEEEPLILKGVRGGSGGDLFLSRKEIRISDCVLDTLHVVACERLTLTDSILRGNVTLNASQSLTVQNCEFHRSVTYDARQGSAKFTQNVFTVPLTVDSDGTNFPPPTTTQNSFIGPFQAVPRPGGCRCQTTIGTAVTGPSIRESPQAAGWKRRGATVSASIPRSGFC